MLVFVRVRPLGSVSSQRADSGESQPAITAVESDANVIRALKRLMMLSG